MYAQVRKYLCAQVISGFADKPITSKAHKKLLRVLNENRQKM